MVSGLQAAKAEIYRLASRAWQRNKIAVTINHAGVLVSIPDTEFVAWFPCESMDKGHPDPILCAIDYFRAEALLRQVNLGDYYELPYPADWQYWR